MTRLALTVVVFTAGVTTVLLHHDRPVLSVNAPAPVTPRPVSLTASRFLWRKLLPAASPRPSGHKARHHTSATTGAVPHVLRGGQQLDITMYCATGNQTASGAWPQLGMAAGNRWPFGTRLHIDGYGDVTVTDRIGWGSDVDIFGGNDAGCESRALSFGRRHALVSVVSR